MTSNSQPRSQSAESEIQSADSDIAVVGMACRLPGAKNTEEFWSNLQNGIESIDFLSDEELLAAGVEKKKINDPAYVKARSSLAEFDEFDAKFFNLSPRDAAIMDPQHRHFLECAYECLEHAGHTPKRFKGSIGVFAGSGANLYLVHNLFSNPELVDEIGFFQVKHTGNDKDYLATRLSYCLDLKGPSINVQTACSTSLVAIHTACQNLLNGECDMALAGGVTIDVSLLAGYLFHEGEVLSPDGHCRSFDHKAKGTIFGNGVGVVALRRLEDAIRDGDTIHAVIKGSAVNNDGSSKVGYLAPSVEGQFQAIVQALGVANVPADSIAYVEAHGTGTIVGDPIEVRALSQAFQLQTKRNGFCGIGSVKTNVGHLDTAAGVTGFIKVVESIKHAKIPPSLNFEQPNPSIDFENSPFYVNTELRDWPEESQPRRASVNSVAVGGTNAHVIVEEAPLSKPSGPSRTWQTLLLSARSEAALEESTKKLKSYLQVNPDVNLGDVAYTLQTGRAEFENRRSVIVSSVADAVDVLQEGSTKQIQSAKCPDEPAELTFMFTGQGSQYVSMGREIYDSEPTFRKTVDRCAELLKEHLGFDLRQYLFARDLEPDEAAERLKETAIAQPALFVIEYSLAQLWIKWGLRPHALIGHSIGEYVAACIADVFSLEDALMLVAVRGRLMQEAPPGAMLAVRLSADELQQFLEPPLCLAAVNSVATSVVSGPTEAIEALQAKLKKEGVGSTPLMTSHAFHSAMMDGVLKPFAAEFTKVHLSAPKIPFVANVTGEWIKDSEATDPNYWVQQLRQPVQFAKGLATLFKTPDQIFLEVGPGSTLATLARQHPSRDSAREILFSLPHAQSADSTSSMQKLMTTLGQLWINGAEIDWDAFYSSEDRHRIPLPTYPFEHQRHWIEERKRELQPEVASIETKKKGRQDFEDWFWKPTWQSKPLVQKPDFDACNWLVFTDESLASKRIHNRLNYQLEEAQAPTRLQKLVLGEPGDFGSLRLRAEDRPALLANQVEIEVRAVGLNFRDVLIALGAYPDAANAVMGSECAGIITRIGSDVTRFKVGDEAVSIIPGCFKSHMVVDASVVAHKPKNLSFDEAAAIPVNFMTADYALSHAGCLKKGERVLIHAAAGGVGMAAVRLAQRIGAEVFATAGSPEKREFLHSMGIEHVFSSRSLDFADDLLKVTNGQGVDVILNALAGEFITKGLEVLRPLGRFLEIGKADIYDNNKIGLEPFKKNISFCSIDLEIVAEQNRKLYEASFQKLMSDFDRGELNPPPTKVFPITQASEAFQYMAKAKHIGKLVLSIEPPLSSVVTVSPGSEFKEVSTTNFEVDPSSASDFAALWERLIEIGRVPDRIIHAWAEDGTKNFDGLLNFARTLAENGVSKSLRLVVVSRGMHLLDGDTEANPIASLALGPVCVIPKEIENISCTSADFSCSDFEADVETEEDALAERILVEAQALSDDCIVAYRGEGRFVKQFEQVHLDDPNEQKVVFREGGVYVITGGFSGIGLSFARHLAQNFQAKLVLIGRTPVPSRDNWSDLKDQDSEENVLRLVRAIEELEALGAEILPASGDVADETKLKQIFELARMRFGSINGVIHSAGSIEDAPIALKSIDSAHRVLSPKVNGTLALHQVLYGEPLDFFVLCSSVSSIIAPAGQVDYVAANAFLDAFAKQCALSGKENVVSINWSAWRDVGMAMRALEKQSGKKRTPRSVSKFASVHPLIQDCTTSDSGIKLYSTYPLSSEDWLLGEHKLETGSALLPGTGYLDLIRGVVVNEANGAPVELIDVSFRAPFSVEPGQDQVLQIRIEANKTEWNVAAFSVLNKNKGDSDAETVEHVVATAKIASPETASSISLEDLRSRFKEEASPKALNGGPLLSYGPRWSNIEELYLADNEAFARIELPQAFVKDVEQFRQHPAMVDMAASCGLPLVEGFDPQSVSFVPIGCERLVAIHPLPAQFFSYVRYRAPRNKRSSSLPTFDITFLDEGGKTLVELHGFTFKKTEIKDMSSPDSGGNDGPEPSVNSLEYAVRNGIAPSEGIMALQRILQNDQNSQMIVSPLDLLSQLEDEVEEEEVVSPAVAPQPTVEPSVSVAPPAETTAPTATTSTSDDKVEAGVLQVLKKALGVVELSRDQDFFEMGGDSLSAMRVVSQLKSKFSVNLPIGTLFENPTAAELTNVLHEELES